MKKHHIKLLALVCILITSLITTTVCNEDSSLAAYNFTSSILADYSDEFFAAQDKSINIYNLLLNEFYDEETLFGTLNIDTLDKNDNIYPDYYGGAYINDEGNLVV